MSQKLPLEGLKVVAVEQAVAAPLTSARLADAGAQVIKIERPEGDFARGYDTAAAGQSSYFVWLNRGKTSVALDLKSPQGREALEALLQGADVFIENLKPGALARLGFSPERLEDDYPALITCSISGFNADGPLALRKAYDLIIQAESGLCSITGGPLEPARVGVSIVDIATGQTAYAAILEALVRRGITGKGARISLSMFDVIAEWLTVPLLNHEAGNSPQRIGLAHPSIAPYGAFATNDEKLVLISIQSDREWRVLCSAFLGNAALGVDPRFATNIARTARRTKTDELVGRAFADRTFEEAISLLEEAGIAFAPVNDMAALSTHPELRRITLQTPGGPISCPAPAPVFVGEPRIYGPVPDKPES